MQAEKLTAQELLETLYTLCREEFVATVRRKGDELVLRFAGGQSFTLTVWENKLRKNT